jgi:TRAP-type transport system periplasmic protein
MHHRPDRAKTLGGRVGTAIASGRHASLTRVAPRNHDAGYKRKTFKEAGGIVMRGTPRLLLLVLALVSMAGSCFADTWRMATKQPPDSPEGQAFQLFADKVAEYSNGELEVQVFPSEQLGDTEASLEQLQAGTIHIYAEGSSYLQKWVPAIKYLSAPFLFDSREHWARFMQSDLVKDWMAQVEEQAGITVIGDQTAFVRGPYRVLVTSRPVATLEDAQGLKLRLHPDELAADAWQHLGAETRVLGWTEVYESIDRGIVEAVNSPVTLVESMRFYEVAPHIVRHNEYPQSVAFMANAAAYNGLSPELREAVDTAYAEAAAFSVEAMDEITSESIERMKAEEVTYDEIDTGPFVERMRSFYAELDKSGELPEGFLDAVNATR